MLVVFVVIELSFLEVSGYVRSFRLSVSSYSWATLLYQGYSALLGQDLMHSMAFGLMLVALVAVMAQALRMAARAR